MLYAVHQPFDSPGNPFALKVIRKPTDQPIFDSTGHRCAEGLLVGFEGLRVWAVGWPVIGMEGFRVLVPNMFGQQLGRRVACPGDSGASDELCVWFGHSGSSSSCTLLCQGALHLPLRAILS